MANNTQRLVWIDMEMSGLDPEKDKILEVALIVTEADLTIVAEAPVFVIHQSDEVLNAMDQWNKGTHGRSGLIDKVRASTMTEEQAEEQLLAFVKQYIPEKVVPLCGNSVSQDRRFMFKYMPKLEAYLHYRTVDVSTFKELAKRWRPDVYKGFEKKSRHEALADIRESIDELAYYRTHFLNLDSPDVNSNKG